MQIQTQPANTHPASVSAAGSRLNNDDDLDLGSFIAVLRAHWRTFAAVALGILGVGLLIAIAIQPRYESTGVISVENVSTPAVARGKAPRAEPGGSGTDVALLRSVRVARRAKELLGQGAGSVSDSRLEDFRKHLAVSQAPSSSVIRITYRDHSPEQAARIVNAVIEAFRQIKAEKLEMEIDEQRRHLADQAEKSLKALQEIEKRIAAYRLSHELPGQTTLSIRSREIVALKSQLAQADADLEKAKQRWRQVEDLVRRNDKAALAATLDSTLVRRLREQETNLYSQLQEMRNEYGLRHPKRIDLESRLRALRERIDVELKSLSDTVREEVVSQREFRQSLQSQVNRLEAEIAKVDTLAPALQPLQQKADALREAAKALILDANALDSISKAQLLDKMITVISPANIPDQAVFPRSSQVMALAALAALLLAPLAAFIAEHFNPKVTALRHQAGRRQTAVSQGIPLAGIGMAPARNAGAPLASATSARDDGSYPRVIDSSQAQPAHREIVVPIPGDGTGLVPATEVLAKQHSRFAESIRALNQALWGRLGAEGAGTILVSGQQSPADKLSIVAALAALNANAGHRVVVVDLTRGETEVHRAFGMRESPGVADVLRNRTKFPNAVQTDFRTRVSLLARGSEVDSELAIAMAEKLPSLLAALKRHFDVIFLVVRNLDTATGVELVSRNIDQALIVISSTPGGSDQWIDRTLHDSRLASLQGKILPVIVRH